MVKLEEEYWNERIKLAKWCSLEYRQNHSYEQFKKEFD